MSRTQPVGAPTAILSEISTRSRRSPAGDRATAHPASVSGPATTALSAPIARQSTAQPGYRSYDQNGTAAGISPSLKAGQGRGPGLVPVRTHRSPFRRTKHGPGRTEATRGAHRRRDGSRRCRHSQSEPFEGKCRPDCTRTTRGTAGPLRPGPGRTLPQTPVPHRGTTPARDRHPQAAAVQPRSHAQTSCPQRGPSVVSSRSIRKGPGRVSLRGYGRHSWR